MIQVKRLAHATFSTPDLEKQVEYWTHVMGLTLVERNARQAILASRLGQESVVLEQGDQADLQRIAFQIAPGSDLVDAARKLNAAGVPSERRSDLTPGVADALVFTDPKGTLVEVYSDYRFHSHHKSECGVDPLKIGHVASRVHDVEKVAKFYQETLGFRVSDWIGDHFVFMRCGAKSFACAGFAAISVLVCFFFLIIEVGRPPPRVHYCTVLADSRGPIDAGHHFAPT